MEVKSLMLVIFQCPYAFLGLNLLIFIFLLKEKKEPCGVVGARLPRKEIFSTIFFKLKCQWAFVWNFRMWQEHAGGGVTPSENVRGRGMKDWEYLEMRLGGLTTMWSLDHIYIRLADIWEMETCATNLRLTGIYGQYKAFFAPHHYLPHIQTLTHSLSELNCTSWKTF